MQKGGGGDPGEHDTLQVALFHLFTCCTQKAFVYILSDSEPELAGSKRAGCYWDLAHLSKLADGDEGLSTLCGILEAP